MIIRDGEYAEKLRLGVRRMNLRQAFYEAKFENEFLRAKGGAFQTFFMKLMGLAHKTDFMPSCPWGRSGDHKNDGFLKSEKCLFQVYAPNEMSEKEATKKIMDDFSGAKAYWGNLFVKWVFVHNAHDGIPPHVQKLILDLEQGNAGIKLGLWGLEELREVFRRLSQDDCASLYGPAPDEETKARIGFGDLQVVLESLAGKAIPLGTVNPVPAGKIKANDLSESVGMLIRSGMAKAPLVSSFFESWNDEGLGERVATAFRAEYARLRQSEPRPNNIFESLQTWAGGGQVGSAEHQMAVLTILAYYFERCDIFEEPQGRAAMILPSKHLSQDRALLTVGSQLLMYLSQPKTVSGLWQTISCQSGERSPLRYDAYILALDLLFLLGAIELRHGLLHRRVP